MYDMNRMPIIAVVWTSFSSEVSVADIGRSVPALAALISLFVGIAAGIAQISSTAKARRTIEWINSTIDKDASNRSRQHVLKEIRLSQEGKLIAAHYVPWWKFMALPISVVMYIVATAYFQHHYSNMIEFAPFQGVSIVGLIYVSEKNIEWYVEKTKIVDYHRKGLPVRSTTFFNEVIVGANLTVKACVVFWVSGCVGYALFVKQQSPQIVTLLVVVGFCSLLLTMRFVWKGAHGELRARGKDSWSTRAAEAVISALQRFVCQKRKTADRCDIQE